MNALIHHALSRRQTVRSLRRALFPACDQRGPLLLCATLLLYPMFALAQTSIDERRDVLADGHVEIVNVSGSVEVIGWERSEVAVTGTLGRGVERLEFQVDDDRTLLEVIYPRAGRSEASHLVVKVPEQSSLEVRVVSASIDVEGVNGRQRLNSVSGDIETELAGSDLEAESVSGDLDVEGSGAPSIVSLKTVSGSIEASALDGELEAGTVSGRIEVNAGLLDRARLGTTSGRMTLEGGLASGGRYDISSTSGRVNVRLDHDADLDLDLQSFAGDIENCFGLESKREGYSPERSLRFRSGAGDRTVRIRTMSGSIGICADEVSG